MTWCKGFYRESVRVLECSKQITGAMIPVLSAADLASLCDPAGG